MGEGEGPRVSEFFLQRVHKFKKKSCFFFFFFLEGGGGGGWRQGVGEGEELE